MSKVQETQAGNLVERLLSDMRESQQTMSVYLVNGFQLKGTVLSFDQEAILFKVKDAHQLVMRSGVVSMYPVSSSNGSHKEWWHSYVTEDQISQPN